MSDQDPKPTMSARVARMQDEARRLEDTLVKAVAGVRVNVSYDAFNYRFDITMRPVVPVERYHVDEDVSLGPKEAYVDLLARILRDMQTSLHDKMADAMAEHDARGRTFRLSKDDKRALHDMFMRACEREMSEWARREEGDKQVKRYTALMERLYR